MRILFIVCLFIGDLAFATENILRLNSAAPALHVEKWLRGQAIPKFEPGSVYILEFWSTWCGPCVESIPHLEELQKKYKEDGLVVIGVASNERGEDILTRLEDWLQKNHPGIGYHIAYDSTGKMNSEWTAKSLAPGIPEVFVVDRDGKLAFVGHPAELPLWMPAIMAGTYRVSEEAKERDELATDQRLNMQQRETVLRSIYTAISKAEKGGNWAEVITLTENGLEAIPGDFQLRLTLLSALLNGTKDYARGFDVALAWAAESQEDPWVLTNILQELFHLSEPREHLPKADRFATGKDLSERILHLIALDEKQPTTGFFYMAPVAQYFHEAGEKARALSILEDSINELEAHPMRDKYIPYYGQPLAQALANMKGQPVCIGDVCLAPKSECETKLTQ